MGYLTLRASLLLAVASAGCEPTPVADRTLAPAATPVADWPLVPAGVDIHAGDLRDSAALAAALDDRDKLQEAYATLLRDPRDEDAIVWYGRRLSYCGHHAEAIDVYSKGLRLHPDSPRLLRHRGHRWITLRRLPEAVADLERAAARIEGTPDEIEPDGKPNARNQPTSTLHTNVWYHLGLVRYLLGDFDGAARAWRSCLEAARNPDMAVAARAWAFLALQRAGHAADAARIVATVQPELDVIENHAYHRLCLLYRGALDADAFTDAPGLQGATAGYGLARWLLATGETARGRQLLRRIVERGPATAFGCIAAEADLARGDGD